MEETRRTRFPAVLLALSALPLLTGFSSSPRLDDARFTVRQVSVPTGPAGIANGGTATYTFTVSINRGQQGLLDGTNNVPAIRPGLYVGNTRLAFVEIDFPAGVSTATVTLPLSCDNNEVIGGDGRSGHGARQGSGFLGWPWFGNDPAQVTAKLNGVAANGSVAVLCGNG